MMIFSGFSVKLHLYESSYTEVQRKKLYEKCAIHDQKDETSTQFDSDFLWCKNVRAKVGNSAATIMNLHCLLFIFAVI